MNTLSQLKLFVFDTQSSAYTVCTSIEKPIYVEYTQTYNSGGAFKITAQSTDQNLASLKAGQLIWIEKDFGGVIEYIHKTTDKSIVIGGKSLDELLNQRYIYNSIEFYNSPLNSVLSSIFGQMSDKIGSNISRNISLNSPPTITAKFDPLSVLDIVKYLCQSNDIGYQMCFTTQNGIVPSSGSTFVLNIYEGSDKSESVVLSLNFDSLSRIEYENSIQNKINYVKVIGKDGFTVESYIGQTIPSHYDRREGYVNCTSIAKESMTDAQYRDLLLQKAEDFFLEHTGEESCEADVTEQTFKFETDYNLGDIVKIYDSTLSVELNRQVVETTKQFDTKGSYTKIVLGKPQESLAGVIEELRKEKFEPQQVGQFTNTSQGIGSEIFNDYLTNKVLGSGVYNHIEGTMNSLMQSTICAVSGQKNSVTLSDSSSVGGKENSVYSTAFSFLSGLNNTSSNITSSIIGGERNSYLNSTCSIVAGELNTISDFNNYGVFSGYGNTLTSAAYSIVSGSSNTIHGMYSLMTGYSNTSTNSPYSIIGGESNNISAEASIATGYNNSGSVSRGLITGQNNSSTSTSVDSILSGSSNELAGCVNTLVTGGSNLVQAVSNGLFSGYNNSATGALNCMTVGSGNFIQSVSNSIIAGIGNTVSINNAAAIGSYNSETITDPHEIDDEAIFTIGNGQNTSSRSNAMLVSKKGNCYVKNKLYVNGQEVTSNSYVDTYSTTETLTNKVWIDGKPIYRIVYQIVIPVYSRTDYAFESTGVNLPQNTNEITFISGYYKSGGYISFLQSDDGTHNRTMSYYDIGTYYGVGLDANLFPAMLYVYNNNIGSNGLTATITVEYTKISAQ